MVDEQPLEVAGEEVARDAQRQLGLLVDQRRRLRRLRLRLDRLPEALQEVEVALDVLGGGALGGGADDHAALLGRDLLEDRLQAVALVVVEPPRDAEAVAVRDVDDEAAGQRDLGREPRALRLHRVLDRLDEDRLAALDQVLDLARALAALELGADDLVDVEEAVLLEADLDERGLHARQDVVDDAEVDVAGDRAVLGPLEVDLGDDARPRARRRASRPRRPRRAARASPSAAARALGRRATAGLRRAVARRLALGASSARAARASRRPRSSAASPVGGRPVGRLLLAVAPTARPAAALLGGGTRLSVGVRSLIGCGVVGQCFNFEGVRGGRGRRLLLRLLASEPGQWQTISP